MAPDTTTPRPVSYSRVTIVELMIPAFANFGGKVHGGTLLSLMDKVAYACAAKHSGGYCVTAAVDKVEFLQPVQVGELVSLAASVNYVGRSSLVVGIRVTAENVETGTVKHTNTSYFTMVAKDPDGRPREVPPLLLENKEDLRRCLEAIRRKEIKLQFQDEFDNEKSKLRTEGGLEMLKEESVVIGYT